MSDRSSKTLVKRQYFLPEYGVTVEATSPEDAEKIAKEMQKIAKEVEQ